MELRFSVSFDPSSDTESLLGRFPSQPAVFALFPRGTVGAAASPYLARSRNLHQRLARLLSAPRAGSRMLNLRGIVGRIDYQAVGSSFEAQWLLYLLNKDYYPTLYRVRLRLRPPALLKINLSNRFPRCYPTRRISNDGALYYGPFPSQVAAERFAAEFLDFFKIRRCVEDLDPYPSHPGCVYSQVRMCLAPCFAGCTDADYHREVEQVVEFLDAQGRPYLRSLEGERARASEALEFEQAAKIHRRIEKVNEVLRQKSEVVRNLRELHAVMVQRGAEPKSVAFFRVCAGTIRGPMLLSVDENVPSPVPLDEQLHHLLESLAVQACGASRASTLRELTGRELRSEKIDQVKFAPQPLGRDTPSEIPRARGHASKGTKDSPPPPPWEHLSLLARWYYSSFREGELMILNPGQDIPHARLIRTCRKLLAGES